MLKDSFPCGPRGPDGPVLRKVLLELPHPTENDHTADLDRVLRGLEDHGWPGVQAPLGVVAGLPKALRAAHFSVIATVALVPVPTLLRLESASAPSRNLGLAVDLGSTNIVGALIDLDTGETLGERSTLNPQIEHGEDILARTHACLHPGSLERLQALAATAISEIAAQLAAAAGSAAGDICCACVAGNTTMAHFLLGLDPYHLCRAPYVPVANRCPVVRAAELGLGVNPAAPVIVLPNVGSYVGGDALAGVLVSGMHTAEQVSLLVDIGTNAEIVVGNREFLLVGAGSAGPGLEGGVVRHGMRAAPGAIERVAIDSRTLLPAYEVIGGGAPRGICGSGLIDLMAELFSRGIVDGRGKFVLPSPSPRVVVREGGPCFVVAEAAATAAGGEILFTQADMDNLMLSKAAMYTMLTVMTEAAGVAFGELEQFFIAGAFGAYVAADKAVTIGMVPDIPLARYRLLGNSSLEGARRVLLSTADLERIEQIGRAMTYVEMNESRAFMNGFMAARFLPHTDLDLFPSVRERLAEPRRPRPAPAPRGSA
ncbi:MAG: ASKHA domain-containing protein [Candidatus Methylomirabilia bacterium]